MRAFIIKIMVLLSRGCLILFMRRSLYRQLEDGRFEYMVVKGYVGGDPYPQVFYDSSRLDGFRH